MATYRSFKKQRRAAREKAIGDISAMSDDNLKNLAHELGREANQKSNEMNEVRARLDAVRREKERRDTVTSTGLHISDHAVLRYLERHKGVDTKEIREEIAAMARKSGKLDTGQQYQRSRDEESGLTLGINGVSNVVTTVFHEEENNIFPVDHRATTQ